MSGVLLTRTSTLGRTANIGDRLARGMHIAYCILHIAYFHRVIICCLYIIVLYCCRQQGDTRTSRHLVKIVVFIWLYCSGAGSNGHTSRHLVINVVCLWLYCTVAGSKGHTSRQLVIIVVFIFTVLVWCRQQGSHKSPSCYNCRLHMIVLY